MATDNQSAASGGASPANGVQIPSDATIVIAVRNIVLFPGVVAPITINRPKQLNAFRPQLLPSAPVMALL